MEVKLDLNQQERINKLVQVEDYKFWLGGFIESEGALVISVVKNDKVSYGIVLQPEFNIIQHESGINILYSYKSLFNNLGTIRKESEFGEVWVYTIKGTQNMKEYIMPFFEKYIVEYSFKFRSEVFQDFCDIITKLDCNEKKTMKKEEFIELIKKVYTVSPDGKPRTLGEVIKIIEEKDDG